MTLALLYDARLARRGLGISTFVIQLARALVATAEVELIWLGDPALAPAGTARAVRVDRRPYPLLDGPAGRALARRTGAELIHFTGNTGWGRPGPVPSVLTLHDLIFLDSGVQSRSARQIIGHRYERRLVPRALAAADVLIVPSHAVATQVRARLGVSSAPQVVHEGVTVPEGQIAPGKPPVPEGSNKPAVPGVPVRATRTAGPGSNAPYLVAFAGRDPRKQTAAVVSAWRSLAASPLHLQLLAAGGMPAGLRESLEPELASGTVEIHPHLPGERLWPILQGALALVYPSRDEGFGLPVLEGMAAGTPVLSGIAPATREIGGTAILQLDPADVTGSIVATVRHLLTDPGEAETVRARGIARVGEFTWEATAAGYLRAYHEATARRG